MNSIRLGQSIFIWDRLSLVMVSLVIFVSVVTLSYAQRYMVGDSAYRSFFLKLSLLVLALVMLALSDHLLLTFVLWGLSNMLLIALLAHKNNWAQAIASAQLAARTLLIGWCCLGVAFVLLYRHTHSCSISQLTGLVQSAQFDMMLAAVLIVVAAMTQSAIWPCQRWLLSSLNSPTPVSAIMHAGLVNGGGWLLARFGELILAQGFLLNSIFFVGLTSAVFGGIWKLQQQDIKRMLTCSTMSQMGFMFMQIGAGLFPLAICHLCLHGMFKANLFLTTNTTAIRPRLTKHMHVSPRQFILAAVIAGLATVSCAIGMSYHMTGTLTTLWLVFGFAFIASTQFTLVLVAQTKRSILFTTVTVCLLGYFYGLGYFVLHHFFDSSRLFRPQPLNVLHVAGFIVCCALWLLTVFQIAWRSSTVAQTWWRRCYVLLLNASQPHPDTVTACRQSYHI